MNSSTATLPSSSFTIAGHSFTAPVFFPDATYGVVRNVSSVAVEQTGIEGLVINTYHLMHNPGIELLTTLGGIGELMQWPKLFASDSGGFQLFSLINKNPDLGKVTDEGVVLYTGSTKQKKILFTPEDSIRVQFAIKSHIMICLDDFTPYEASEERIAQSVDRTIAWAKRCKAEFEKQVKLHGYTAENRPWLFGVIQGHRHAEERARCAKALTEIDFDGYGLGGWLFDENKQLDYAICQQDVKLTPDTKPRFALGIGNPHNIVELFKLGYHIFDCVLPTRDARHQRLYVFNQDPHSLDFSNPDWFEYLYISRGTFATDKSPISPYCDCFTCQHYSKAYLNHLFKVKDTLAFQLATIHNLRFYAQLVSALKQTT